MLHHQAGTKGKSYFLKGALDGMPFFLVIGPFALLFGIVGTDAGLHLTQIMGFSIFIIAGAAQLTAVQMLVDEAPTIIVIATALAVNLRMAMYSAALVPHLGAAPLWQRAFAANFLYDQPYALSTTLFEEQPQLSMQQKMSYYFGVALPIGAVWWSVTLVGALLSESIPKDLGVEFAAPVSFLAVVAPLLRSPAHIATALSSAVLVMLFQDFPNGTGLICAAGIALVVGARVEIWQESRAAALHESDHD
jgi:predicted branched-subunit amino acid permease